MVKNHGYWLSKKESYGIRKLTVGTCSLLLGSMFFGMTSVSAQTVEGNFSNEGISLPLDQIATQDAGVATLNKERGQDQAALALDEKTSQNPLPPTDSATSASSQRGNQEVDLLTDEIDPEVSAPESREDGQVMAETPNNETKPVDHNNILPGPNGDDLEANPLNSAATSEVPEGDQPAASHRSDVPVATASARDSAAAVNDTATALEEVSLNPLIQAVTSSGVDLDDQSRFSAAYAFDQDPNTRYAAPRMKQNGATPQDTQIPQWIQVDLGQFTTLTQVKVDFFNLVYATDYEILTADQADASPDQWRQLVHRTSLANNGPGHPSDHFILEEPQHLDRYLRFRFNKVNVGAGGYAVSIKDIDLKGYLPASDQVISNLALNRPALASGLEAGSGTQPQDAFDDDPNTRWAGGPMKQSTDPTETHSPQWLQVDLGTQARVSSIDVDYYLRVYSPDYKVLTSATGQEDTWVEVARSSNLLESPTARNLTDTLTFDQPKRVDRYLRFQFDRVNPSAAGNSVSVKDIRVNGYLLGELPKVIDPVQKLRQASLSVVDNKVVLSNIEEDDQYHYELIGSSNQYVVANDGSLLNYRLNDMDVVMLVAARRKADDQLVTDSKVNMTVHLTANHQEQIQIGSNLKPQLALEIQEFLPGEGYLDLKQTDTIHLDGQYLAQIDLFNQDLANILGYQLHLAQDPSEAKIRFHITDDYDLKEEGYLIRVDDQVDVYVPNVRAINYAAVTLAQMLQAQGNLTKGVYRDYPNYAIRGMLLDVARIPQRMDFLEEVSHLFRWYKLNELHLHLNDNQWPDGSRASYDAWKVTEAAHRLESTAFPSLNKIPFKHDRYEGEYDFYRDVYGNPAYSLEEFLAFQKANKIAGVNILAEIDTPGHSAAYSIYALDNPDNIDYLGQPINHPQDFEALAINPTAYPDQTERAKRFVKDLIGDYIDAGIFDYDQIHLGVDEYWQKSGNIEPFRQYLNEMNDFAQSKGKTIRTWGALSMFQGTTPVSKDIIFDEWSQGESVTVDRINEGYRVVNVPQPFTYMTPGRNHKDIINEQYVWDYWRPNVFNLGMAEGRRMALEGEPLLLGAKGAMWGDEHAEGIEPSDLYFRLEKSLAMIGSKTWNAYSNDHQSFIDYQKAYQATRLKNNFMSYSTASPLMVHLDAKAVSDGQVLDLSGNGLVVNAVGTTELVEIDGDQWLAFDGSNYLETNVANLGLPYTLEMTFIPDQVDQGYLLLSQDGALALNGKGRSQDGEVHDQGLTLNRYFYSQHLGPQLQRGQTYKLTLTGTREVLNVYLNNERIASLSHVEGSNLGTRGNFRTSFNLPLKTIASGFKGYIKDLKVYNRTMAAEEIAVDQVGKMNLALHKPVYDFRHNSDFWNQNIRPYHKDRVTDGDVDGLEGRWNTSNRDGDYIIVDLETSQQIDSMQLIFDDSRIAQDFSIAVSDDLENFSPIYQVTQNQVADVSIENFEPVTGRYIRLTVDRRRPGANEAAIKEWRIFKNIHVDKGALAQAFAAKPVNIEDPAWVAIENIMANKYASEADVAMATNLLDDLIVTEPVFDPTADDDGDGYSNEIELHYGSDYQDSTSIPDVSQVGESTSHELPSFDLTGDEDQDGYSNEIELHYGSDYQDPTSIPDVSQVGEGSSHQVPSFDLTGDEDQDGYSNEIELHYGSDYQDSTSIPDVSQVGEGTTHQVPSFDLAGDEDQDGYSNEVELHYGSDYQDPTSIPQLMTDRPDLTPQPGLPGQVPDPSQAVSETETKELENPEGPANPRKGLTNPKSASPITGKSHLPATGEADISLVLGAAALSVLAGLGLYRPEKIKESN